jgi:hypothetical protein
MTFTDTDTPKWLLPMPDEDFDPDRYFVRGLGLQWMIEHEEAAIFEHLQMFFWNQELNRHSVNHLRVLAKAVGFYTPKRNKQYYINLLSEYFQDLIDRSVNSPT